MKRAKLTVPELFAIAATRVALGVGIGLLLSARLAEGKRRTLGRALFAAGGLSTIPLMFRVVPKLVV
jgi:hypothetical protein